VILAWRDAGPVLTLGDPDRLRQVLDNLLGNALRYTPSGSSVDIEAMVIGERVRLEVKDCGPGMSEHEQSHVFERFYRADASRDRSSGGSGLGLAIVKTIVVVHGGSVRVTSSPGAGACFIVDLPAVLPSGVPMSMSPEEQRLDMRL
jgi:two-component system OmpR family sensor kinase